MVQVKLSGTSIELLLQWAGQSDGVSRWHLCPPGCKMELEGDGLVHVTETHAVTKGEVEAVGWATNLRPAVPAGLEDENAALRLRLKKLEARTGDGEEALRERSQKRGDRKKKKKRKKSRDRSEGRREVKRAEEKRPQRVQHPRKTEEEGGSTRSAGSKSWRGEAGGSPCSEGQVPETQQLKFIQRYRSWSSESEENVSGDGPGVVGKHQEEDPPQGEEIYEEKEEQLQRHRVVGGITGAGVSGNQTPLFGDELKIRGVSERFPGLLAGEALRDISRMVSADMGDPTSSSRGWTPQMIRYFRQVLSRRISGAMARELLTHCSVIDSLLEGNIPRALDIALQRIKGLELQAGGTAFQVSQRLEVIPSEASLLPSRQEIAIINRESATRRSKPLGTAATRTRPQEARAKQEPEKTVPTTKGRTPRAEGSRKQKARRQRIRRKEAGAQQRDPDDFGG